VRLLVLGGSSFVGAAVLNSAACPPDPWWTFRSTEHRDERARRVDLLHPNRLSEVLHEYQPTHIIDTSLPGKQQPGVAAAAASIVVRAVRGQANTIRYVYVSTDAVFSGALGRAYRESDAVDPCSPYGDAKARAERIFLDGLLDCCVVRTALVFGVDRRARPFGPGPRELQILERLRRGEMVPQYSEQYRTPTEVTDLAHGLLRIAACCYQGIVHVAGSARLSRAEFARRLAAAFRLDESLIVDQPCSIDAEFGADTSLDSSLARSVAGWASGSLEMAVARMADELGTTEPPYQPTLRDGPSSRQRFVS
jgi:dTDP-4-dehydrorhamnose reductase